MTAEASQTAETNSVVDDRTTSEHATVLPSKGSEMQTEPPKEEKTGEGRIAVYAAILGNILVGIVKFIAAGISGSSAMVSEGIHSIVDSGNGVLVLIGLNRSHKLADEEHPFGYGKELYFWTLVVSVLIFALGGGMSIFKGIQSMWHTFLGYYEFGDPTLNYIVIIVAAIIEGSSLFVAIKQLNLARGDTPALQFIKEAKDPSIYTVVLEDSAAELGLVFAFFGVLLSNLTGNPYFDGGASVLIGLLLCVVAVFLLLETKGLLIGEGLQHDELLQVQDIVEKEPSILSCGRILTMYFGPEDLLVALDVTFKPEVKAKKILRASDKIEEAIKKEFPQTSRVFIKAEALNVTVRQKQSLEQDDDRVFEQDFQDLGEDNLPPALERATQEVIAKAKLEACVSE